MTLVDRLACGHVSQQERHVIGCAETERTYENCLRAPAPFRKSKENTHPHLTQLLTPPLLLRSSIIDLSCSEI